MQSLQYTLCSDDFGMSEGLGNVKQHLQEFIKHESNLRDDFVWDNAEESFPLNLFDQSSQSIFMLANTLSLKKNEQLE